MDTSDTSIQSAGIDVSTLQQENQNLINEKIRLQEKITILQEQLLRAGITPLSPDSFDTDTNTPLTPQSFTFESPTPVLETKKASTYGKRRGTADCGKEYEYLMCAYYALKFSTSDFVDDFQMSTNDETYGDFDDIVLTVKFADKTTHKFLFQLKHSENRKNITAGILTVQKGDFSLLKYFKSYKNLKNNKNLSCILFTNRAASIKSDSELILGDQEIGVKQCRNLLAENLINTSTNTKRCSVFQFEVLENEEDAEELEQFFKDFYLLSNQNTVGRMKIVINEILKQLLCCDIFDNFVNFMKTWWSANYVLNKEITITKLAELVFSPSIKTVSSNKCNERTKLLQEAINSFEITIIKDECDDIGAIWEASFEGANSIATNYGFNINQLSPEQRSKLLWHLDQLPLIVKVEDSKRDQIFAALKLLKKNQKKKKILLLGSISREDFLEWVIFENLADLHNHTIYAEIVKKFKISLQGRESVTLQELISDLEMTKIFEVGELFSMTQSELVVGFQEEDLPSSYISRTVSTIFLDTEKVLNSCDHENDLLIINCDRNFKKVFHFKDLEVKELYHYLNEIDTCRSSNLIILSTKSKCTIAQFDEICRKVTKRNIYLLQIVDQKSCTLVLSKENPTELEEMRYNRPPIEEDQIYTFFDNPINALCAQPGMGKSIMATYLQNNTPASFWSVRINLKEYSCFLRKKPQMEEILGTFLNLHGDETFLQRIKVAFLKNKRIYLFLDGLDETDSNCVDFVLSYIKFISSSGVKVWVCSRQILQDTIINQLGIFTIDIQELNEWQQKQYIQDRLSIRFAGDEVVKIIKNIFNNIAVARSHNLLGVPLKLFIITENFLENRDLYETLNNQMFVLTTMYRIFFEGKKKHQYKKVGVEDDNQLGFNFSLLLEQYEIPALKSCLDDDAFDRLNLDLTKSVEFLDSVKNYGDKFGIISQIQYDRAVFSHQTYAEYFACVWLKKNLDKVQLLRENFFLKKCENLRFMFDIMLAEQCPLHLAVIYKNLLLLKKHIQSGIIRDEGGRNPLQLICSYGTKHVPLTSQNEYHQQLNMSLDENSVYRKIVNIVVSKFDPYEKDAIFEWDSLDYAVAAQCISPVEAILATHGEYTKLDPLYKTYSVENLAYYSSKLRYQNLLTALLRQDPYLINVRIGFEQIPLLHIASKNNNLQIVDLLLDNCADINIQDDLDRTALHLAAEEGHQAVITTLLKKGADVNKVTRNQETILHYAARNWKAPDIETIKLLVNCGVNINAKDKFGITALHLASEKEYYDMVEELVEKGADTNALTCQGESVLHYAVRAREPNTKVKLLRYSSLEFVEKSWQNLSSIQGQEDIVKILLDNGARINAVTRDEETVLHYAAKAWKPNLEVIKLLVENEVDINAANKQGVTALHRAFQKGHYGVIKILLDQGADVNLVTRENETILHYATRTLRPNTEIIELLVDCGLDINAKDKDDTSVLHWASEEGHFDVVKVLVQKGADVNAHTRRGDSVLHYAAGAWKPNAQVMKLLANSGVDVSCQNKNGITALHYVAEIGYYDVAKILLQKGANVNAATNKDETALHYATKTRDPNNEVVRLLVDSGVDVNRADSDGITSLHWASERGHYGTVKILIDSGADVNAVTNAQETVLNYAIRSRDTSVIALLVSSGIDVNHCDKDGASALHKLSEIGSFDIVKLLVDRGAFVDALTNKQETVLHYAAIARGANTDVIGLFIKNGVDIDAKDQDGKTALHWAVERGLFENMKVLIENRANVGAVTATNLTAVHYAVYRGRVEMVEFLLEQGVDVGALYAYNDELPLYFALRDGRLQADLLLEMTEAIYDESQVCCSYQNINKFLRERFPNCKASISTMPSSRKSRLAGFYQSVVKTSGDLLSYVICRNERQNSNQIKVSRINSASYSEQC